MCVNSCLVTTAYVFLLVAVLACALSYVAPFWILIPQAVINIDFAKEFSFYETGPVSGFNFIGRIPPFWVAGLWSACRRQDDQAKCGWFWENDFYAEKNVPDWHKATQGLFGGGLIFLIIGFCLATFHICCRCCKESFSIGSVIGSFIITGTICVAVGIGVYGGFMYKDHEVGFDNEKAMFYWGFFVGVAGVILALVSGILFFCRGCCDRNHTGYHMTRVV